MKTYYKLQAKQKTIKEQILQEKKRLHSKLVERNQKIFYALDILVIICVCMNFGAVALTNALVIKESVDIGEEIVFYEMNPSQAEMNQYEQPPEDATVMVAGNKMDMQGLMVAFMIQTLLWFVMIATYVYYRRTIFTEKQLMWFASIILFYFFVLGIDFFNDFGFYIGKIIFGG